MSQTQRIQQTVTVDLDVLLSLLESAIGQALTTGKVYEKAGLIGPIALGHVSSSLAAGGHVTRTLVDQ